MRVSLLLMVSLVSVVVSVVMAEDSRNARKPCQAESGADQCSRSNEPKSRKKRTVYLPNQTSLVLQSRLTVPQLPTGLYLVWIRIRFFVRAMFTEPLAAAGAGTAGVFNKRSAEERFVGNILTRSLGDDQVDILGRVESSLDEAGLNGRQCVLKTICELTETPIHEWSLVGEMIYTMFRPKQENHTMLTDYQKAEQIGLDHGDCWSFYPDCPFSIFNFIPDIYTSDDTIEISLDKFGTGSSVVTDEDELQRLRNEHSDNVKEFNIDLDFS